MNFAVIGLGKIGVMHSAMTRCVPGARLAALVDRVPKLGQQVQSMMSAPPPFFPSIEEAAKAVPLQGVLICTPQFAHRQVAETCLELGLDVFVEKPLAHNLADAEAMMAAAKRKPSAVTAVGYMKAHEGIYRELERILKAGAIGPVKRYEATCYLSQVFGKKSKGWIYTKALSGGGMVINSTCHLLHSLYRWFGTPKTVTATCKSIHSTEVEDEADVTLEYAGYTGHMHTSWSVEGYAVETSNVRIEGAAGVIEVHRDRELRLDLQDPAAGYEKGHTVLPRERFENAAFNLSPAYGGEGYFREDADFVRASTSRGKAEVTWDEGLAVQRLIDAIYRSDGKPVAMAEGAP